MGQVLKKKMQKGYERTNKRTNGRTEWLRHFLSCSSQLKTHNFFFVLIVTVGFRKRQHFENWVDYVWPKRIFKKRYVKRENRKKLQEEYFEEKQLRCLVASSHCILISWVTCHSGWLQLWQHNMPGRGPIQPFCADFLKIELTRSQCWWCRNTTSCGQH